MAVATFGAGCFWGVEATFGQVDGVKSTTVGYSGGQTEAPTYEDVCADITGHAEVVQVEFDPDQVGYEKLLGIFWECHDPTQLNRQGVDIGTQYRSVIFTHSPEQQEAASVARDELDRSGLYDRSVVTTVESAGSFWPAEDYHQQYFERRGLVTCHI